MTNHGSWLLVLLLTFPISTAACAPIPGLNRIGAYSNERLDESVTNQTNATTSPKPREEYFIGLALSGGGSRAANFSASVMLELDRLGILKHVQYISSVSGSSLPAAYYALFKGDQKKWEKETLKKTMSQCFECWGVAYLLNQLRLLKFIGTSYDRTNVMSEVFEHRVFDHRTFSMLPSKPRLILNATNYITGGSFAFTNETFDPPDGIASDLARLQISEGVIASAAYPGGFRNVTLKNFARSTKQQRIYLHLFDGGMSDNLGIDALLRIHEIHVRHRGPEAFSKGCLLISVDAFTPYFEKEAEGRPDTRTIRDVIIDSNALNAFSILLDTKRRKTLDAMGLDEGNWRDVAEGATRAKRPIRTIGFLENLQVPVVTPRSTEQKQAFEERRLVQDKRSACKLWHIALTQIGLGDAPRPPTWPQLPELYKSAYEDKFQKVLNESYAEFGQRIRGIPTRFFINEQNALALYAAGELLVQEPNSKEFICGWLRALTKDTCQSRGSD